jgi:divalent metal cation (Fe/Co/Zn/Cd) transporter
MKIKNPQRLVSVSRMAWGVNAAMDRMDIQRRIQLFCVKHCLDHDANMEEEDTLDDVLVETLKSVREARNRWQMRETVYRYILINQSDMTEADLDKQITQLTKALKREIKSRSDVDLDTEENES